MSAQQPGAGLRPRWVAAAILAAGACLSLLAEWPGTYVYDSVLQILEGRNRLYSFWHPPVMSWLLGLADAQVSGGALFMLGLTVTGFGALMALLWLPRRVGWGAVIAALLIVLTPHMFMFQGYVLKDVLFADAALAGFVALGLAVSFWRHLPLRWLWLALSGIFLLLAILARQNGVIFLLCAAIALGTVVARHGGSWRNGAVTALAFFIVVGGAGRLANAALSQRHDGTPAVASQFRILRIYDLTGIISRHPQYRLKVFAHEAPDMDRALRAALVHYDPGRNDTLLMDARFAAALESTPFDVVNRQWRAVVAEHPAAMLVQRAEVFSWLFLPTHTDVCHPYYVGAHGPADALRIIGMKDRMDQRDWLLYDLGAYLSHTPLFWHPLFALMAFAVMLFCFVRRRPADIVIGGYMVAALCFTVSFFAISIACDYRYLYALDLSALAGALYWASDRSIRT